MKRANLSQKLTGNSRKRLENHVQNESRNMRDRLHRQSENDVPLRDDIDNLA